VQHAGAVVDEACGGVVVQALMAKAESNVGRAVTVVAEVGVQDEPLAVRVVVVALLHAAGVIDQRHHVVVVMAQGEELVPGGARVADAGHVLVADVPADVWDRGGHHVLWSPDGDMVTMNLRCSEGGPLRFTAVDPHGGGWRPLSETVEGSGHPIVHPDGRTVVTDAYLDEAVAFEDGTVPIRLLDLESGSELTALRVPSDPDFSGPYEQLRVDPHPAWGPSHRFVAFNACPSGRRRVFLADFGEFVG